MGRIDGILKKEEFLALSPLEKAKSRGGLFKIALEDNSEFKAKFDASTPEQRKEIADTFAKKLQEKYPEQFSTKGTRRILTSKGNEQTQQVSVPIRDIETETFISQIQELSDLTHSDSPFISEKDTEQINLVKEALLQIPKEDRGKLAPLVHQRVGFSHPELKELFPSVIDEREKSTAAKVGDFAIPGVARILPPLITAITTRSPAKTIAAGGAAELAAEGIEIDRGIRKEISPAEVSIGAFTSAIPALKGSQAANLLQRTATNALVRGGEGAAIGGSSEVLRQIAKDGKVDLEKVGLTTALGFAIGAPLGAAEAKLMANKLGVKPESIEGKTLDEIGVELEVPVTKPSTSKSKTDTPVTPKANKEGTRQRQFTKTLQESDNTAPEVKTQITEYYDPINNQDTYDLAKAAVNKDPEQALARVMSPDSDANAENVLISMELMRRAQTDSNFDLAADIALNMSRKATSQGQAIQALSVWNRLTTEGAIKAATRIAGEKLPANKVQEIKELSDQLAQAGTETEKLFRAAKLEMAITGAKSATFLDKVNLARKLSMLLNLKTVTRNIGGNAVLAVGETGTEFVQAPVDKLVSVFTGSRTVSTPSLGAKLSGFKKVGQELSEGYKIHLPKGKTDVRSITKGLKGAFDYAATLGRLTSSNKYDLTNVKNLNRRTYSSRVGKALEDTLSVSLGLPDRVAWWGAFRNSVDMQKRVAALNGQPVANPSKGMVEQAHFEANRAIFQDDNIASNLLGGVRNGLNLKHTKGDHAFKHFGPGDVLIPFSQVPGSIFMRGIEYSPMGFVRSLYETMPPVLRSGKEFDQKAFVESFSRAATGSTGLFGAGYLLHEAGIMTSAPEENRDVENLRKSLGMGGYRLNVSALKEAMLTMDFSKRNPRKGDVIVSYDWAQPASMGLAMGAQLSSEESIAKRNGVAGKTNKFPVPVAAGIKTLEEQPLISGLTSFMRNAGNRSISEAALHSLMVDLPASFVPTVSKQVNELIDNQVIETRGSDDMETAYLRVASKVPRLARELGFPPRRDVYGDQLDRYQNAENTGMHAFNVFINPAFINNLKKNPISEEVLSIFNQTGDTSVVPKGTRGTITINGVKTKLNAQQRSDMAQFEGRLVRDLYGKLILSPKWNSLPTDIKAKTLSGILRDIHVAAKVQILGDKPKHLGKRAAVTVLLGRQLKNKEEE